MALLEIQRPPNNFFDEDLINALGDAFDLMDETPEVRALVLAAQGKHFCAGRNFASPQTKRASEERPEGWEEQRWLQSTNDHQEGLKAVAERRVGNFTGT